MDERMVLDQEQKFNSPTVGREVRIWKDLLSVLTECFLAARFGIRKTFLSRFFSLPWAWHCADPSWHGVLQDDTDFSWGSGVKGEKGYDLSPCPCASAE